MTPGRYGRTMQITRSGRFVFVAQWVAAFVLPLFVIIGRGLIGSPLGWMMVIGIWFGLLGVVAMYIPPILTLFDGEVRRQRATRRAYTISTWVVWIALLVLAITIVDGGDSGGVGSALTVWTGDAVSDDVSNGIALVALLVAFVALAAACVLAIVGIVRSAKSSRTAAHA